MMTSFYFILFSFLCLYVLCENKNRLVFYKNVSFAILQLADLHYGEAEDTNWGPEV
jgi:hypothetical protein